MQHWADRLGASGLVTVDALRARSFSPRVYFLLDAPAVIRQRAERIALHWPRLIGIGLLAIGAALSLKK